MHVSIYLIICICMLYYNYLITVHLTSLLLHIPPCVKIIGGILPSLDGGSASHMVDSRYRISRSTTNRGGSVTFSSSLSSSAMDVDVDTSGGELSSSPSVASSGTSGGLASSGGSGGTNSTSTSIVDLTADSSDDEEVEVSVT